MPISTKKSGSPDGIFGVETDTCVRDFQRKSIPNASPDGKVGPMTLSALDGKLLDKKAPASTELVWGHTSPGVPGSPDEADLGTFFGPYTAVKQAHDMACWAACLSFWARYCGDGRPLLSQGRINALYGHYAQEEGPKTGGISTSGYERILQDRATPQNVSDESDKHLRWNGLVQNPFHVEGLTNDWLKRNTSQPHKALLFGYTINGASHVNVIGHYDLEGTPYVWVMEPWVGRFRLRDVEFYRQSTRSFWVYPN
jgi:hypothetical protein